MTTATQASTQLTFACTDCGRRAPSSIECPCGGGPLVDLSKAEFRAMIVEIEDRRSEAHDQILTWAGVGVGVLGLVATLAYGLDVVRAIPLPVPFSLPIKLFAVAIGIAALTMTALRRAIPAKRNFPELVAARSAVRLPSRLLAPKRSTWIALGLFVASGLVISVLAPIVRRWSAEEERGHAAEVGKRYEALVECVDTKSAEQCKPELEGLHGALDGRRADAAVRAVLSERVRCTEDGCDVGQLDKHFDSVTEAMRSSGHAARSRRRTDDWAPLGGRSRDGAAWGPLGGGSTRLDARRFGRGLGSSPFGLERPEPRRLEGSPPSEE
jgi:hypothetical protein